MSTFDWCFNGGATVALGRRLQHSAIQQAFPGT
jgi:hypothetical protein